MTVQPCKCFGDTRPAVAMLADDLPSGLPMAQVKRVVASEHAHVSRQSTLIASVGSLAFLLADTLAEIVAPSASSE